jgi:hypothetical protein
MVSQVVAQLAPTDFVVTETFLGAPSPPRADSTRRMGGFGFGRTHLTALRPIVMSCGLGHSR